MEIEPRKIRNNDDILYALEQLVVLDPKLIEVLAFVQSAGVEVPLRLRPGGFEGLAEIVISQLVSKASANAINHRFLEHVNPPTPERFLVVGESAWKIIGLSRPKQKTLVAISQAMIDGKLDLENVGKLSIDEAINHLTDIKGIGPWSAQVYLLFCCGHGDIFPSGDLALREAARMLWRLDERPSDKELALQSQIWSPWRGVAARLLWAFYAVNKGGNRKFQ